MSETNEQHSLRIFTIISQIEQLLETSPKPKLGGGGNRRILDIDEMFDLLGDLKVTIPEDIRRANSVLLEADTLLEHANQEALDTVDQAQKEADQLKKQAADELAETRRQAEQEFEARVAEDSVLQEVQRRCELLQRHAEHSANTVYEGAKQYADAILQHLQNYLIENYHRVEQNRSELGVIAGRPPVAQQPMPGPGPGLGSPGAGGPGAGGPGAGGPGPGGPGPQAMPSQPVPSQPVPPQPAPLQPAPPPGQPAYPPASAQPAAPAQRRGGRAQFVATPPAAPPVYAPVEPLEPAHMNMMPDERPFEEAEEDWAPKRKRGWFRRADEEEYFEDDDAATFAPEQEEAPRRRSRRSKKALDDDLDLDLDE